MRIKAKNLLALLLTLTLMTTVMTTAGLAQDAVEAEPTEVDEEIGFEQTFVLSLDGALEGDLDASNVQLGGDLAALGDPDEVTGEDGATTATVAVSGDLLHDTGVGTITVDGAAMATGEDRIVAIAVNEARYQLVVEAQPPEGGEAQDFTDDGPYVAGTEVDIMGTPAEDWMFVNWTTEDGGEFLRPQSHSTNYIMPANDATIVANFAPVEPFDRGAEEVIMEVGETTIMVDGEPVEMDVAPFIREGRTMVPMRFFAEAFAAEADWGPRDGATEWVEFTRADVDIELEIGSDQMVVVRWGNPELWELDVPASIVEGRVVVPFRAVAEAFLADVDYEVDENGRVKTVWFTQDLDQMHP